MSNKQTSIDENSAAPELDLRYKDRENYTSPEMQALEKELITQIHQSQQFQWIRVWYWVTNVSYLATILIWIVFWFTYNPQQESEVRQVSKHNGKVYVGKVITLHSPRFTDAALRQFTQRAMNNIYNLSFLKFQDDVAAAEQYFCEAGYQSYRKYLEAWGIEYQLGNNNQLQRGAVSGQINSVGGNKGYQDDAGNRYWLLVVPMNIARIGSRTVINQQEFEVMVKMEIAETGKSGFCIEKIKQK